MKLFWSIVAIAITMTFSAYAEQPKRAKALLPDLSKCFDLLRLESLQIDPQTQKIRFDMRDQNQVALVTQYFGVAGWLRGFFTGVNMYGFATDGDITKDTKEKEWMLWIYSYCRAHPTENLESAAVELAKALNSKTP